MELPEHELETERDVLHGFRTETYLWLNWLYIIFYRRVFFFFFFFFTERDWLVAVTGLQLANQETF